MYYPYKVLVFLVGKDGGKLRALPGSTAGRIPEDPTDNKHGGTPQLLYHTSPGTI